MYRERPVLGSDVVSCTWRQDAGAARSQLVVPDACIDFIWDGSRLSIAGPDTSARTVALSARAFVAGVRIRPGAAGAVLGLPASEVRDQTPLVEDVLGREVAVALLAALHSGVDPEAALLRAVALRGAVPDPLVLAAVRALDVRGATVAGVAAGLGVSERQLRRRVADAVGYGPKVLARVLRFQRLRSLDPAASLASRAFDAGYADQAHMTTEVSRLTGLPAGRFLQDRGAAAA